MLLLTGGAAQAQAQALEVTEARLRLLPGDMPGAGYVRLHNPSDTGVTLTGAHSDAFQHTEMHMSREKDGMASMQAIPRLEIAAGESLDFAPKGYHLMFMKRVAPLGVGDEVEVELRFEDHPPLPVTFEVISPVSLP